MPTSWRKLDVPRAASGDCRLELTGVQDLCGSLECARAATLRVRCAVRRGACNSCSASRVAPVVSRASVRRLGGYRTGDLIRVSSQQSVPEQADPAQVSSNHDASPSASSLRQSSPQESTGAPSCILRERKAQGLVDSGTLVKPLLYL